VAEPDRDLLLDLQRKALTPKDFADLDALAARITAFEDH
jgi:hypothetical protein